MNRAYLLLGSNVDPEIHVPEAVRLLRQHGLVAVSQAYETRPVGTASSEPFLNAAVLLETNLEAMEVKTEVCRAIEQTLGRVRDPDDKFAPRTIDLDLAWWNAGDDPPPDPDIVRYLHAARPLADLAPDLIHPVDGRPLAVIAADLESTVDVDYFPRPRPDVILSARP